ncbi:membrane protein insertion efficiency factor YidD [Arenibacterium sp. CAU 1754]
MLSRAALYSIALYQRWISPRKGYRCAYSVAHGGTGCSGFAKGAIREHGLWAAMPIIRGRFRDCRAAYDAMCDARRDKKNEGDQRRRKNRWYDNACLDLGLCCPGPSRSGTTGGGGCDLNPCDGGGCDCSPCS